MIDTNVKGLLTMTRLVVPGMVKRGGCGQIINIGSVAGDAAYTGGNVYLRHQGRGEDNHRRAPHR